MKRGLSILTALVILLALIIIPAQPANAARHEQMASNHVVSTRNGVVRFWGGNYQSDMTWSGSGFAIGIEGEPTDVFGTNHHVVEDADVLYILLDNEWRSSIPELGGTDDGIHAVRCQVIYDNTRGPDYAIVRTERLITERTAIPLMLSHQAYPGDTVFALGYPGVADNVTDSKDADIDSMTVTKGTISRFTFYEDAKSQVIQIDAEINHGNSGGPLVTEEGYVIGLNTWGVGDEDGLVYLALEVDYVIDTLDELIANGTLADFHYTKITERPSDEPTEATAASTTPTEVAPTTPAPVSTGISTLVYVLIGVCVVIAATSLYLVIKLKKRIDFMKAIKAITTGAAFEKRQTNPEENKQSPSSQQPAPQSPQAQVTLTGISGVYAGRRLLVNKSMVFGRQQGCDVPYADNVPGISGSHCQLIPMPDGVILMDKGSTHGTYLANGTKLIPNQQYPLHSGDCFYLASKGQGFRVEIAGNQPANNFTLVGVEGSFAGRRFPIRDVLTMGRSANNTLVFPQDAPGVSGNHCSLSIQEKSVVIVDLGSTYGTYCGNGRKLEPNQKTILRKGDVIYVGTRQNAFRIE